MGPTESNTLLDELSLELPHDEPPEETKVSSQSPVPMMSDQDNYVYNNSGPRGEHIHIPVFY
jgi:hypothetical protein